MGDWQAELVEHIEGYESRWVSLEKWQSPNLKDAAIFLSTEAGEALSEVMKSFEPGYTRNNPAGSIDDELADVLMMLLITARESDTDLESAMLLKLHRMDKKRRG